LAKKEKEIIFCGMVGVVPINIKKERAGEARGQKLPRDENPTDGGRRSSNRKR
jgi:hypothetical protein